jgi:hypothetical protein
MRRLPVRREYQMRSLSAVTPMIAGARRRASRAQEVAAGPAGTGCG